MTDSPLSASPRIAAMLRNDLVRLKKPLRPDSGHNVVVGFDPERESRLNGLMDGVVPTVAQANRLEGRIGELRQASRNAVVFRQALFLLGRVEGMDPMARMEMVRRAMAWWRARSIATGSLAKPWAKSLVLIAEAQAGRLGT